MPIVTLQNNSYNIDKHCLLRTHRWKSGVASSLTYVSLNEAGTNRSPILHPYPSWAANIIKTKNAATVTEEHETTGKNIFPQAINYIT